MDTTYYLVNLHNFIAVAENTQYLARFLWPDSQDKQQEFIDKVRAELIERIDKNE